MKANAEQALAIGWNAEAFHRTKTIKPLEKYLQPARKPSREQGARDVKRMFDRMIAKQGGG